MFTLNMKNYNEDPPLKPFEASQGMTIMFIEEVQL
jgi:hypothetical protein